MHLPLRLAALVLCISGTYYAVVAFAPYWLHHQVGGFPLSILLGFGIFVAGAAVSLFYAFAPASFVPPSSAPARLPDSEAAPRDSMSLPTDSEAPLPRGEDA